MPPTVGTARRCGIRRGSEPRSDLRRIPTGQERSTLGACGSARLSSLRPITVDAAVAGVSCGHARGRARRGHRPDGGRPSSGRRAQRAAHRGDDAPAGGAAALSRAPSPSAPSAASSPPPPTATRSGSGRSRRSSRSARSPSPPHAATPCWSGSRLASRSSPASLRLPARHASNVVGNLLVVAFTLLVGDLLRVRRDQNALLAERNRELEEPPRGTDALSDRRGADADRARGARRGRAFPRRDHPAGAGLRRLPRSPERTGQALREIETLASRGRSRRPAWPSRRSAVVPT